MRLFTAVLFNKDIEASLYKTVESLRNNSKSGTFTRKENLHLTVNFIGETTRLDEVKQVMNKAVTKTEAKRFFLSIGGLGKFKRREGDIFWVGVEKNECLWSLQKALVKELQEAGFNDMEDMEYTPHLTLGRRVKVKEDFQPKEFENSIQPMKMDVSRISLMKSEQIDGRLVYSEIYHINLN